MTKTAPTRFAFDRLPADVLAPPSAPNSAQILAGEAGSVLERAAHLRADPVALAAALATGRVFPIWRGRVLLDAQGAPAVFAAGHAIFGQGGAPIYLGYSTASEQPSDLAQTHWFCVDISAWEPEAGAPAVESFLDPSEVIHPAAPDARFVELRGHLVGLDTGWGERFATARALSLWHVSHRFCAACGQESTMVEAGWQRRCESCGTSHFPRTDPVVIMLVTRGNSVLMGRSPAWPERMFSCLAGFVEPGETVEAAVAREVFEETAVQVGAVRYLASQPWPFPASLMLGMRAEALTEAITIDPNEIAEALWMTREELADAFAGQHPTISAPRKGAIAEYLLRQWLADAPGFGA